MKSLRKYSRILITCFVLASVTLLFLSSDSEFVRRLANISTILLAILTGVYVVFTYRILRSTRESSLEQTRPFVFASLVVDEIEILLSVKNSGNRPAYDVHITFDPSLDVLSPNAQFQGAAEPLLNQAFMAPNFEVRNFITSTMHAVGAERQNKRFRVEVQYADSEGNPFSYSYFIDLGSYVFDKRFLQFGVTHYLKEISESLKKMLEHAQRRR